MDPRYQSKSSTVATISAITGAMGVAALLLFSGLEVGSPSSPHPSSSLKINAAPLSVSFSFSPNPVSSGSSTQISVSISGTGAVAPFYLWFNNTPQGCQPSSSPIIASATSYSGSCNPTSQGTTNVRLDVVDSNTTAQHRGSASAMLTVTSNGGNNNGGKSNNNSNGSFNLFSGLGGLFSLLIVFGAVFLGALVAIAAGTIATAVAVSRRLRQINETLKQTIPPGAGKPPT